MRSRPSARWTSLKALPAGLGRLRNLQELDFRGCDGLAELEEMKRQQGLPALLAHLAGLAA